MKKARVAEIFRVIANEIEFEFEPAGEGVYTVTVPALPGCVSEGDSFEEALANIKDALEGAPCPFAPSFASSWRACWPLVLQGKEG